MHRGRRSALSRTSESEIQRRQPLAADEPSPIFQAGAASGLMPSTETAKSEMSARLRAERQLKPTSFFSLSHETAFRTTAVAVL